MANRYWVGGTGNWDLTNTTNWSATSGGSGGATVPTSTDDVFFDSGSGSGTVTVTATVSCQSLDFTGYPTTSTFTGTGNIQVNGNLKIVSGFTFTHTGIWYLNSSTVSSFTIQTGGNTLNELRISTLSTLASTWTLQDALTANAFQHGAGTFTTNNYNLTLQSLTSNTSNTRTLNFGSSVITLSGSTLPVTLNSTGLTVNAGTSTININNNNVTFAGANATFYDVSFNGAASTSSSITGANTFRNLTITGRNTENIHQIAISANQTITGTLTVTAGFGGPARTFLRSNTIGTTRTLTCNAVSFTDTDFRDITIAGSAIPVIGTRLGDCKGNSGITFDASKTVYTTGGGGTQLWVSAIWATSPGGSVSLANFPLAQDTAVVTSGTPTSGGTLTIGGAFNLGTIDMSARTTNTMTLATGTQTPSVYGNWINGTGITISGTGTMTFAGRGSQTLTSSGKTFTQTFTINTPGGSVTLQDALLCNRSVTPSFILAAGTFDANGYNVTLSGLSSQLSADTTTTSRTLAFGSGTWTIAGSGGFTATSTNLTVTGTGTISLTSSSAKTFAGGGISYAGITLNQGGSGALTISGSNTFKDITNTYSATGATSILFTAGTTQILSQFTATGASGKVLTLGSTTTSQATLQKGAAWLMGANSTNGGNNTGLSFTSGGGIDYLSVSYINGTVVAPVTSTGNFLFFF